MRTLKQKNWMTKVAAFFVLGMASVTMTGQTSKETGKVNPPTQAEAAKVKEIPQGEQKENNKAGMENIAKLKQLNFGLRIYQGENMQYLPSTLDALKKEYVQDAEMYVWTSPEDGSKGTFIYFPPALGTNPNLIVAASPRPANGKREALYLDGHCSIITEEEFQRAVKEQSQDVKNPVVTNENAVVKPIFPILPPRQKTNSAEEIQAREKMIRAQINLLMQISIGPEKIKNWAMGLPDEKDRTLALECMKENEARKANQK